MLLRVNDKLALRLPRWRVRMLKGKKGDDNDDCEGKEKEEEEKRIRMMAVMFVMMMKGKLMNKVKKMRRRL